jgi:peptidoglycan/LPS O-acetylase OafA/YrhL
LGVPAFRTALYAFKAQNGFLHGSLPVHADQLAIGCLLAVLAPRLPKISGYLALAMIFATIVIPAFPASSSARTLFMLFVLRPLLHVSIAGCVLHVMEVPYRALNWAPVAWLGRISYSVYLWQELFLPDSGLHLGYAGLPATLACACLSYYMVEQPLLRLRDMRPGQARAREQAPGPSLAGEYGTRQLLISEKL